MMPDSTAPQPKPGTSADVEIILDERDGVLRVPTNAVIENKQVLVIEDGKAVTKPVTIGLKNWDWSEIKDGLKENDRVITSLDRQGVKAGARVAAKADTSNGGRAARMP
jgi:HlyD family secretion protein